MHPWCVEGGGWHKAHPQRRSNPRGHMRAQHCTPDAPPGVRVGPASVRRGGREQGGSEKAHGKSRGALGAPGQVRGGALLPEARGARAAQGAWRRAGVLLVLDGVQEGLQCRRDWGLLSLEAGRTRLQAWRQHRDAEATQADGGRR